jgi:CheY-like chemotaxis protein
MDQNSHLFLYIEDEPASRMVMQFLITRILGAQLAIFEDTGDFVEKLHGLPTIPKVIFLDIHVGPVDGYGVLSALRNLPDYRSVPVIAMTASVTSTDIARVKDAGFDGLIGKPIKSQAFPGLLKRIMTGESIWYVT